MRSLYWSMGIVGTFWTMFWIALALFSLIT